MTRDEAELEPVPAALGAAARDRVDGVLSAIEDQHSVRIVFAIESESRAWGFPSPDSDYDCRFVFVRRHADYLTLWPERDVIERPIEGDLDINGWDVGKAIRLLCKGNAVILEWLDSPLVYRERPGGRARLSELAKRVVNREQVARHYLHLGEEMTRRHLGDETVSLKKIFYALRPAFALRWLRRHDEAAYPPMHFPTLLSQGDLPADVAALAQDLIERKAHTRELGSAPMPEAISRFLAAEFAVAREAFASKREFGRPEMDAADGTFRAFVAELG